MSEAAVATGPSAGALLRQAREAAGLHVAALAVSLKVPVRKLEALEDDRYEQLTDAVFARALASSVCRTLKVDPRPILDRLPQTTAPRLVPDHEGIGAPFRAPGDAAPPGWREYLRRPVTLAVAVLLVGALAILLLPNLSQLGAGSPTVAASKPEATEVAMAASAGVPAGAPAEPVIAPADTGTVPGSMNVTPVAVQSQPNTTAAPAAAPASAAAAVVTTTPAAPANGVVVFKASGPSWIEVVDKQGNVALRRLLAAGESAGASGALPLAVTVGSVNTTAVEVRGKPFDLGKVSRDNVARFEIK